MIGNPFWTKQKGVGCQLEYFQFITLVEDTKKVLGMSGDCSKETEANSETGLKRLISSLSYEYLVLINLKKTFDWQIKKPTRTVFKITKESPDSNVVHKINVFVTEVNIWKSGIHISVSKKKIIIILATKNDSKFRVLWNELRNICLGNTTYF